MKESSLFLLRIIGMVLLLSSSKIQAEDGPPILQNISGEKTKNTTFVYIYFDKTPSAEDMQIEQQKGFVQINLHKTILANSGSFYDIESPYIEKVATFQTSPLDTKIRLFLSSGLEIAEGAVSHTIEDQKISIALDHRLVRLKEAPPQLAHVEKDRFHLASNSTLNSPVLTAENMDADREEAMSVNPIKNIKVSLQEEDNLSSKSDFKINPMGNGLEYLQRLSIFFGLLCLMIFFFYKMRGTKIAKKFQLKHDDAFPLEIIGKIHLSPKVRLLAIQAGDEKFLISVAADEAHLVSRLGEKSVVSLPMPVRAQEAYVSNRNIEASPHEIPRMKSGEQEKVKPKPNRPIYEETAQMKAKFLDNLKESLRQRKQSDEDEMKDSQKNSSRSESKRVSYAITDEGVEDRSGKSEIDKMKKRQASEELSKKIKEKLQFVNKAG
ncbi:MAG: hypothetical protein KA436_02570 [Oligoflexales bacterium]|nr:hypothetical protein [Oligoflexales bacterium]